MIHLIIALLLLAATHPPVCTLKVSPNVSQTQESLARYSIAIGSETLKITIVSERGSRMKVEVCVADSIKQKYRKTHVLSAYYWSDEEETVEYQGTLVTVLKWSSKGNASSKIYLAKSVQDEFDIVEVELPASIYRHIQAFDKNTRLILERDK